MSEKKPKRPPNTGPKLRGDRKPSAGPRQPRKDFGEARAPRSFGPRREEGEGRPPRKFGDRPARREGGFGGKPEGRGPRREGGFEGRPPRREGGFGGKFEGRGPRREGGFGGKFEGRPPRREGGYESRGPRSEGRGPRPPRASGDRPFRKPREEGDDSFRSRRDFGETAEQLDPSEGGFFRPHVEKGETYYHGRNATLSLFKNRPRDIIRVYVREDLTAEFKELLNYCAAHRLAYHTVGNDDLERITETKHHDGICVLARDKRFVNENDFFKEIGGGRSLVLYLDGVGNPHNLGAILRTAAHFGVRYVAGEQEELPRISPAANRTSEGGAEEVSLVRVEEPEHFFDRLKKQGFQIYAFDPAAKAVSLFDLTLNEKAVFVMGAEVEGLSGLVKSSADVQVRIPGTGAIESLNVSVAAALAMAEFSRQSAAPRNVRIVKNRR